MQPEEIKIQASIVSDGVCRFTVDRPVYPGGSVYFRDKELARGSPMAQKLFEIGQVVGVLISENVVKVTKVGSDEWLPIARRIGAIVRAHMQSGEPAVSETVADLLPAEELIREKVRRVFDDEINPMVAQHGGNVELVDVKGNMVFVRLGGGCQGCGMADLTLRQGIESLIREYVPEVGDILDVTDHAEGENPYYPPQ